MKKPGKETFMIDLNVAPENSGTASGKGDYKQGEKIYVLATPKIGYAFVNWTDKDGNVMSDMPEYTFAANQNYKLTANFKSKEDKEEQADNDFQLVKEYIQKTSSNPEPDIKKAKEEKDFFDFILEKVKEEEKNN